MIVLGHEDKGYVPYFSMVRNINLRSDSNTKFEDEKTFTEDSE